MIDCSASKEYVTDLLDEEMQSLAALADFSVYNREFSTLRIGVRLPRFMAIKIRNDSADRDRYRDQKKER
ncbi:hypothetical protein D908_16139 [Vibrio mimicus CAIM 602]|nr:hypothetical protein D908_16139 [Vibrio mimicus CAIM 602]